MYGFGEFYLSVLTLHFLWSILFIFCVLAPEGMNSIVFGKIKGRVQKSTTCSEDISPEEKNDILRQYNDKFIMYRDRTFILSSLTA